MTKDERKAAMMRAKFRADVKARGDGICRVCGGRTFERKPYCRRHWRDVCSSQELMHAVTEGCDLEVADEFIRHHSRPQWRYIAKDVIDVSHKETARKVNGGRGWALFRIGPDGTEQRQEYFSTVAQLRDYLYRRRQDLSTRNRWASKTLIR